ncbi:hypothetical protein [Paenibacillus sp. MBLB4367]
MIQMVDSVWPTMITPFTSTDAKKHDLIRLAEENKIGLWSESGE